jgi:high affinity sulfate transporter 1
LDSAVEFVKAKFKEVLPVSVWLPAYDRKWLKPDVIAGLTMAAISIPMLMAYAELAGLPPQYGLYAGIAAGFAYFFFGTIKHLNIGPSSSQAILTASVVGILAAGNPDEYVALAGMAALMVGLIFIGSRILKLGFIVNLIPVSVFKGFLAGVGITIIVGELPKLFGIESTSGDFYTKLFYLLGNLDATNLYTLGLGLLLASLLGWFGRKYPRLPSPLMVVIVSIVIMSLTNLQDRGVDIVGEIPAGLPSLSVPKVEYTDITALVPLAFSLWIITFLDGTSVGKIFENKYEYKVDKDQELVAYGSSNIAAGLFSGFPVAGSFSRSMINDNVGAKTLVAGMLGALLIAVVAMWFTGMFYNMPMVVLAVLIIWSVISMVDFAELHRIRMFSGWEFAIAMLTFAIVLLIGVLEGVLVGVLIAFVYVIYRISHPHIAVLGRVPGSEQYKDIARHSENESIQGVLIVRADAPLIFANCVTIKETITEMMDAEEGIELIILDLQSSPMLDISAADMLKELHRTLRKRGIEFRIANPTGQAIDALEISEMDEEGGPVQDEITINGIVQEYMSWKVVRMAEAEQDSSQKTDDDTDEPEEEEPGPAEDEDDNDEGESSIRDPPDGTSEGNEPSGPKD